MAQVKLLPLNCNVWCIFSAFWIQRHFCVHGNQPNRESFLVLVPQWHKHPTYLPTRARVYTAGQVVTPAIEGKKVHSKCKKPNLNLDDTNTGHITFVFKVISHKSNVNP